TAGVIDYLLETLSKWEGAKERNKQLGEDHPEYDHSIPMHDVVIEVMGGSSAGGMTAAIATLGLFEGLRPINQQNKEKASNKMYEAWVNLNDQGDGKMSTLLQMLTTEDIKENDGVVSLLNSKPIDAIAQRAGELNRITDLPDYISSQLEIILTVTSLRGIPLAVNFFDQAKQQQQKGEPLKPAHRMFLHKGIAHMRVTPEGLATAPHVIPFDPAKASDRDLLLQCAKASGAFPLGLAPRELEKTQTSYIRAMVDRMFSKRERDSYEVEAPVNGVRIEVKEDTFDFFAVDGGTVNNEPFGEVIRALEEKCIGEPGQNYAVLMIDPFPNFESEAAPERSSSPKLMELAPKVLGAIRGQAMMKESDLVGGLSSDHTLRMVFPSRNKENGDKDPYPISCGSLDGFGGFFSRGFREHDFKLGRKNCQSFLRNYFCLPLSKAGADSVFADWNEEDERHKRFYSPDGNGYPIVPDMDFDRRRASNEEYPTPERKRVKAEEILQLDDQIQVRLREVLANINKYDRRTPTREQQQLEDSVDNILKQHYKPGVFSKLFGKILSAVIVWSWKKFGAKTAASKMTKTVLKTILTDFKKRGLLE
ncbi:MAG TPA: patatin-like phospholipase family protein, partial [Phaeodactylibacter sp.]|nr:patatin-like phospholipase family protein [Phaeodactylibacter sp.]